ncbi:malonyl-coenzyme:anthocyanin 5-o-glucoside-6'''-o-malonyltransferase, partial [Phtheirospermum japonicum]
PTQRLLFFDFPNCSESHSSETIVLALEKSLSITISHFLPLSGNIILPSTNSVTLPINRYRLGDSISLTVARCDHDFDYLTGNHQRLAGSVEFPVLALQITLFPGQGLCLGLINHHAVAGESSILNFFKSCAFAKNFGLADGKDYNFPVLDTSLVQDPKRLDSEAWNLVRSSRAVLPVELPSLTFPANKVRATFVLTKNEARNLKSNTPIIRYVSSFTAVSAYVWTCLVKSGEMTNDDEIVYFGCAADCRARLVPPLPEGYFGNCVVFAIAQSRAALLRRYDGFLIAAETIGDAVVETVYGEKGILESADWPLDFGKFDDKRLVSVAGSPRFDAYKVDYGWGSIDWEETISVTGSRVFEGGFEVGLSRYIQCLMKPAFFSFLKMFLSLKKTSESKFSPASRV